MSLVDGDSRQLSLRVDDLQTFAEVVGCTLLWRDVEKPGDGVPGCKVLKKSLSFAPRRVAVDGTGFNVCSFQSIDLVRLGVSALVF